MPKTIAIIGALDKEVHLVRDAVENARERNDAGLAVVEGEFAGCHVVATTAGMGTVNAAATTQYLISMFNADAVIFSGIAGGLNPALHIEDVVIGERLRYLDTDTALIAESAPGLEEFASTPALVDVAESVLLDRGYVLAAHSACRCVGSKTDTCDLADAGSVAVGEVFAAGTATATSADSAAGANSNAQQYLRGTIATGDRFVSGSVMRDVAIEATHADCVEMEGAAIAHIAAKNGVDCLILRAISDNCDEEYDKLCTREFDLEEYAEGASSIVLEIVRRIAAA